MELWEPIMKALHIPIEMNFPPILQKFYDAAHREPVYTLFQEDDGSVDRIRKIYFLMVRRIYERIKLWD